jgi:hypothetical protein
VVLRNSPQAAEERYLDNLDTIGWPLERPECILHAKSSLDAG